MKDEQALEALITLLDDGYFTVRQAAASALGEIRDARAVPALAAHLAGESHGGVYTTVTGALGKIGTPETVAPLCVALEGPFYTARIASAQALGKASAQALGKHNAPEIVDALIAALPDAGFGVLAHPRSANRRRPRLRVWVMHALAETGDPRAVEPIKAYLESDDVSCRLEAALALLELSGADTKDVAWPELAKTLSAYIEETTGRELLEFVPREYLRR